MENTIQMNLFEYFMDEEKFSIQDATNLVKNIKNLNVKFNELNVDETDYEY